jgi:hypothetical protein
MNQFDANLTNVEVGDLLKYKGHFELLESGKPLISIRPDDDILGATVGQAELVLRGIPNLEVQRKAEIIERCNWIAVKLCSLRYHRNKYEELQKQRSAEISADLKVSELIQKGVKICELEMLHEFEGFFYQYKSTLDMLAKILCPITGLNAGTLSTYGKSGSGIIKTLTTLKRNKNHAFNCERIDKLIQEIEIAKSPWLESIINIRDTFSHYRTMMNLSFEWDKDFGVVTVPHGTMDNKIIPLNTIMDKLTEPLIFYCTHFIAIAISIATPSNTSVHKLSESEKKYLGAMWRMNLSRTIWNLGEPVEYTEQDIEKAKNWLEENIFNY